MSWVDGHAPYTNIIVLEEGGILGGQGVRGWGWGDSHSLKEAVSTKQANLISYVSKACLKCINFTLYSSLEFCLLSPPVPFIAGMFNASVISRPSDTSFEETVDVEGDSSVLYGPPQ